MSTDNLSTPLLSSPQPSDQPPELILTVDQQLPNDQNQQQSSNLSGPNHHPIGFRTDPFDLPGSKGPFIKVQENQEFPDERNHPPSSNLYGFSNNPVGFGGDPFGFLGSKGLSVPGSSTIDPFRNHTFEIVGVYEWLKILVCLPVALVRFLLFVLCVVVGYVAAEVALCGWRDKQNPLPKWRGRVMWITRFCARGILFAFGYHWIKRKGRPAPREFAPIIVSNHVSYIEPMFFFYELFPTIVASDSHDTMPVVGTIIRAMQVIYVNRTSQASRKHAVSEIKRKASDNRFPRLLLFPEGTTTNGRLLISFQLGAFIPGFAIQPVVVRYPYVHFDQSWGHISLARLMFRMFTQFHNFMEVEYLPVVLPLENQKGNAVHFAERTGNVMARSLNVVQTSHSLGDYMLVSKAVEFKQENSSNYVVEMAMVEKLFHLSNSQAVEFLDRFLSMNPDHSGHVKMHDFFRIMKVKPCSLSEKIFNFINVDRNDKITFKEFLYGSAHVLKQPLFLRACERAFVECDADRDHYISDQEFRDTILPAMPSLNEIELHGLYDLFDMDGDGRISKVDFLTCLRRNPLLIALFSHCLQHRDLYAS